jgi:uncharacterized protein (TIGR00369 family)
MAEDRLTDLIDWFNRMPVFKAAGVRCERLEAGEAYGSMTTDPTLLNPDGAVPGTLLASFADLVGGMAVATVGREDEYFVTVQLSIQFMRPGFGTEFTGSSVVLRRGSGHTFVRVDIADAQGRTCVAAEGIWSMFASPEHAPSGSASGAATAGQ